MKTGVIIEKGENVKQKVSMLENVATKEQVNVVLRTDNNEAFGILKLVNGETENFNILDRNIIANYIYIDKGVEINNMKFKVEVTEERKENEEENKINKISSNLLDIK